MRHQLTDIEDMIRHERINSDQVNQIASSVRRIENHYLGDPTDIITKPPPARKFSISMKTITPQTSVTDATVLFFVGQSREQSSVAGSTAEESAEDGFKTLVLHLGT